MDIHQLQSGDTVYVIQRNPHTQSAAHIQEAAIIQNPDNPRQLSLFFRDEHYPLTDAFAMYSSYEEASQAYDSSFSTHSDQNPIQEVYD